MQEVAHLYIGARPLAAEIGFDVFVVNETGTQTIFTDDSSTGPIRFGGLDMSDPAVLAAFAIYVSDAEIPRYKPDTYGPANQADRVFWERVTMGSRTSENAGALSGASLTDNGDGTGYVDLDPGLFYRPVFSENVQITGADAGRYNGWELAPESDQNAPVVRLRFSGTNPVTVNWAAQVNPWPDGVIAPE